MELPSFIIHCPDLRIKDLKIPLPYIYLPSNSGTVSNSDSGTVSMDSTFFLLILCPQPPWMIDSAW